MLSFKRVILSLLLLSTTCIIAQESEWLLQYWIPHIAVNDVWQTDLVMDNIGSDTIQATVFLYGQGQVIEEKAFEISAHSQAVYSLTHGDCGLVLSSNANLTVRASYRSVAEGGIAEFLLTGHAYATLNFTYSGPDSKTRDWAGLAVMNTYSLSGDVTFIARDASGQPLAVANQSLLPYSRLVFEFGQAFTDIDVSLIARVDALSTVPMTGISLAGIKSNQILVFTPSIGRKAGGSYVIPHIADETNGWETYLIMDNTTSDDMQPSVRLFDNGQALDPLFVEVPANSSSTLRLENQPSKSQAQSGIVVLDEDGVIFRVSYRNLLDGGAAEFILNRQVSESLVYCLPNYAAADLSWMGFAINNTSAVNGQAKLSAFLDGNEIESQLLSLQANSRTATTLDTLFDQPMFDQLVIESDVAVSGIDISGKGNEQLLFTQALNPTLADSGSDVDELYFPGDNLNWRSAQPSELGWDEEILEQAFALAQQNRSSSVVMSQDGALIAERYWTPAETNRLGSTPLGQPMEDVASVQKSVTSILATMARDRSVLDIESPVSELIGVGWSQAPQELEVLILVRHLLSMTSGLTSNFEYRQLAGSRWEYNTPVYSTMHKVLEAATEMSLEELTSKWLTEPLGMEDTYWSPRGEGAQNANGLITSARDLARVGLMLLGQGSWRGNELVASKQLLFESVRPSQDLNLEYGFLWWLNGEGTLIPTAPTDLVAAQGASGRRIWVVPSMDLVITRMGNNPSGNFYREFWALIMQAAPSGD